MKKEMSLIQKMNALLEQIKNNKQFNSFRKNLGVKVASLSLVAMMFIAGLTSCDQIDWGKEPAGTKEPGIFTPSDRDTVAAGDTDNSNTPDGSDNIKPEESDTINSPEDTTQQPGEVTLDPSQTPSTPGSTDAVTTDANSDTSATTQPVSPVVDFQPYFDTILNSKDGVNDLMKKYYDNNNVSASGRLTNTSIVTLQPTSEKEMVVVLKGFYKGTEMLNTVTIPANFTKAIKYYKDIVKNGTNTANVADFTNAVLDAIKTINTLNIVASLPVNVDQKDINSAFGLGKDKYSICHLENLKPTKIDGRYQYTVVVDTYSSVLGSPSRQTVTISSNSTLSQKDLKAEIVAYFSGRTQDSSLTK